MNISSKTPLETLEMDGGNSWNNMKIPRDLLIGAGRILSNKQNKK